MIIVTFTINIKSITLISKVVMLHTFKRFSGREVGHAPKVLAAVSKALAASSSTPPPSPVAFPPSRSPNIVAIKKPNEVDPTILNVTQINDSVNHKTSHLAKMKNIILNSIPTVRPKNNIIVDNLSYKDSATIQGKEALTMFLQYFENLPPQYVNNPEFLIMFHKLLCENQSEVFVRAYQLALEIYYNKRTFIDHQVCDIFDNKFSILDIIGRNNQLVDTSTFFSALQANFLFSQTGYVNNVDTTVVVSTCINSANLKDLPPELLARMEQIKKATGNTTNDINLNGHHYDFKITTEPYFGRNHIMFIQLSDATNHNFKTVSENMLKFVQQQQNIIHKLEQKHLATKEEKYLSNLYRQLGQKIEEIKNTNTIDSDKFSALNEFIFKNLHLRPKNMTIPIFIPITPDKFQPHPQLQDRIKEIDLPPHKKLVSSDVTKAISNVINNWDSTTKNKAYIDTWGTLGKPEEVD